MAKSKSFFGLRTGSTKSLTFQIYRGQQITKDRVTRISNPRSEAQMKQRALIPIVAASREALRGLIDHSFEGVPYGEQSLKMFSSLNLKAGALKVASFSPNGYSNPGFANLIVSRGTIDINTTIYREGNYVDCYNSCHAEVMRHKEYEKGAPAADLLRELATWAANEDFEIFKPGTQLTFLNIMKAGELDDPKAELSAFHIVRLLFPSDNTLSAQVEDVNGPWTCMENVPKDHPNFVLINKNKDEIIIALFEGKIYIKTRPYGYERSEGMAVIVSKYVNGQWKRNNARIKIVNNPDPAFTYEQWKTVYEKTGSSAKYLNQGDESTGING